jgi:signal transduction histidine kinase
MQRVSDDLFLEKEEKAQLQKTLEAVIERTYDLEKEYKQLKKSIHGFQNLITQLIESQPNPVWIVDISDKNHIFFQNSASHRFPSLLEKVDPKKCSEEIELDHHIFLVQISKVESEEEKRIISATDITEQKRSERLASMGRIAAHLAHEIRNPIGSIALLASTLSKRVADKQKPLVDEIQSAIGRVERIIKSTLLFTKGVGISPKPFPLTQLSEEIEKAMEAYAYTKEIDLVVTFDEEKKVIGDFELLTIVMQNFLYNAIDAIEEDEEEKGCICFDYSEEDAYDTITITDSGVAIADENILYEPFKTTKTKGHGLGLALSQEIVKAHNGKIELLKETKGFKIYLKKG